MTNEDIYNQIDELLQSVEVYIDNVSDFENFDDLSEYVMDENLIDCEIIYYTRAIEYLAENDPSLRESFEIASEYGFTLDSDNFSSETLATLHNQRRLEEEFYQLRDEIDDLYNSIES